MNAVWQNFSKREQIMVILALIFGGLFVVYQFAFLPIRAWQIASEEKSNQAKVGYEQVILAARLHGQNGINDEQNGNDNVDINTSLKSALTSSAQAAKLIVLTTDGNDVEAQISIAATEPDRFYQYLVDVERLYGAVVTEARISRVRGNPALIKADRLSFSRRTR